MAIYIGDKLISGGVSADKLSDYYTKSEIDKKIENVTAGNVDLTSYASDLMLSGNKLQLKNKNGTLIGSSIHLPLNSSGDSGLEFTNENVTSSINTDIDETKTRQEYLGGYIEVQPDQWDGSTPSYDATSNTWGFPYSLNLSDQKKIRELVFHGNNTNIRYIRFPLGFAYRGYRNIDETSKLARNIGERYKGQNQSLKRWFKEIAEAGGGLAPEYWCPPPHWLTGGAYVGGEVGNFISAGGSYDRTTKLASIKTSDPTQYAKQIDDFTNAIIDDLEYLHTNICPVRMFGLQNEPNYSNMRYGACAYDKQTYNDVLEVLYPKILASEVLSFYGDEPNEVKLLVASDDDANPFLGIAKTFIDNHSDWIWGYTHHLMRRASGEHNQFGATGADWFKTENFKTVKGELDNVFINEYEYFGDNFTDEFRCSNNMLRLIFEAVYGGAKVMHPVIHICKPIAQSLASTNTRGYCMFACNLPGNYGVNIEHSTNPDRIPQGSFAPNKIYWHSWSMFGDNLPVNSILVGYYTKKLDGVGWCCFRNANKFYLFLANNTEETKSVTIDFYSNLSFDGKYYDINNCGTKLKPKSGTQIEFVIPPTSGQCWIEQGSHSIITPPEFIPSDYATNGICYYTGVNIDSTTGDETSATDRVSTQYISVSGETVTTKLNYNLGIRFYDKDKFFIGSKSVSASSSNVVTTLEEGTKYIRLVIVTAPTNVSGKTLVSDGVSYTLTAGTSQPTKTLTSISATYNQGSTVIYPDTTLDSLKSNLTVTATYSDNSTSNITNYSLSGTLSVGTSNVTVTYSGKTTTFTVNVIAKPTLISISATYNQGVNIIYPSTNLDTLKNNLVVVANYSDSSTATLSSSDYSLSGTLIAGTSTVTVTYNSKTTTFNVTVTEEIEQPVKTLESITAVYSQGSKVIYPTTSLNSLKSDLVVTANYSDGSQETITDYTLSGTLTVGTSTITVTYNSKTTTFNVTVTEEANDNGYVSGYINDNNEIATLDSTYTANAYKPIQGRLVVVNAPSTLTGIRFAEYDENKQYITRQTKTGNNINDTKFTVSENCRYIRVSFTVTDKSTSNLDNIFSNYTVEPEYTIINCELGGIASSGGALTDETDRYRTIEAMEYLSSSHDNMSWGMTYICREYDDSDSYLGTASTSFITGKYNVKNSNTTKLKIVMKPTDTSVDRSVFKLGDKYYLMKLN